MSFKDLVLSLDGWGGVIMLLVAGIFIFWLLWLGGAFRKDPYEGYGFNKEGKWVKDGEY